jgi:hypothetical protein
MQNGVKQGLNVYIIYIMCGKKIRGFNCYCKRYIQVQLSFKRLNSIRTEYNWRNLYCSESYYVQYGRPGLVSVTVSYERHGGT